LSVTVKASRHPLKADWVTAEVDSGQSIYQISGGAAVAAYINGREVPEELHRLTSVKDNAELVLWPIPQDDNIIRTVATVVVAAVAMPVAMTIAGTTLATAGIGTFAIAAGIGIAGNLAINALIPPQTTVR